MSHPDPTAHPDCKCKPVMRPPDGTYGIDELVGYDSNDCPVHNAHFAMVPHYPQDGLELLGARDLVLPRFIFVDARRELAPYPGRAPKLIRCPLCWERYPGTGDVIEDHHNAQRHKLICKGDRGKEEAARQKLIAEFQAQPHVIALKHAGYAEEIRQARRPRPWYIPRWVENWFVRREVRARIRSEEKARSSI
jgi:hypothetical protein